MVLQFGGEFEFRQPNSDASVRARPHTLWERAANQPIHPPIGGILDWPSRVRAGLGWAACGLPVPN